MTCDDSVFQGTDNWGEQIRCLREEIEGLRRSIKDAGVEAGKFNSQIGTTFNIMKGVLGSVNSLKDDMKAFTRSAERQYQVAEKIAEAYKKTGLQIGLSVGRSEDFSKSFKASTAAIARFGGEISDVQEIYQEFADNSGRVRILGEDEVSNIFQLGKATNLLNNESAALYETLELMGVGYEDATEHLLGIVKDSQNIGVNSSKVMKTLSQNMNRMQTFSFANGVQGMTKMAKLAVKMRMDVGDMLGMAEKFYQPEAAIEAAAELQLLGGDIAKAFGDPFETMYLARNKPEELAEKVGSMVENMMTFNEQTGEYEFPAEARMQLKAAGDQLGINVDKMVEMARQSARIGDVKDKLNMAGSAFSEDEMDAIGSMARMSKDGGFVVDVYDENGEKQTKAIEDLTSGDLKMLVQTPKDEGDYMAKMLDNSMTTNQLLRTVNDTFQKTFVKDFDIYKMYEDATKETIPAIRENVAKSVSSSVDMMKDRFVGTMAEMGVDAIKSVDKKMKKAIDDLGNFIEGSESFEVNGDNINMVVKATSVNTSVDQGGGSNTSLNTSQTDKERCESKNGRIFKNGKCYESNGITEVTPFAKGGIVTKPINALIGEGGESEAVFPLSKLENFIQTQKMGGEITLGGDANITLNIKSDNPNLTFSETDKSEIIKTITNVIVNGAGNPSGLDSGLSNQTMLTGGNL